MKKVTEDPLKKQFTSDITYVKNIPSRIINFIKGGWRSAAKATDVPPPAFLVAFFEWCKKSEKLTWFMAGMSIESLGLGLQTWFHIDCYPLLDAVFAGLIAIWLYNYQKKKVK